jgi:hypothetical protein
VLSQEIAKGFVGELLEIFHLIAAQEVERLPSLVVELDALAFHQKTPRIFSNTAVMTAETTIDPRQPILLEKNTNI